MPPRTVRTGLAMARPSSRVAAVCAAIALVVSWSHVRSARADRALAPTDRLDSGTLDLRVSLQGMNRRLELISGGDDTDIRARTLDYGLAARVWFSASAALRARVARVLFSSASENGVDVELADTRGFRDLGLDFTYLEQLGRLKIGGVVAARFPTGDEPIGLGRTELSLEVIGGYALRPSSELFAVADYTSRQGDSLSDVGDQAGMRAGFSQRWDRLSLIPSVAVVRALSAGGDAVEESFDTVRVSALVGYEPYPGLTGFASVEYAAAEEHVVQLTDRGSGNELLLLAGVAYAWDLRPVAAHGGEPLPPAAIFMEQPSEDMAAEAAELYPALRAAIPRLRQATLAAERRAGGFRGRLRVELTVAGDGTVTEARVDDRQASPSMARAVHAFYLQQHLPPPPAATHVGLVLDFR